MKELNDIYLGDKKRQEEAKERGTCAWTATVGDHPSIADLRAYEELYQLNMIPDFMAEVLEANPLVKAWYEKMGTIAELKEGHEVIDAFTNEVKKNLK